MGFSTQALEAATIALLGAISALAAAAAMLHTGSAQDLLFFASAIAAGGAVGRWPEAFPTREPRNADFDA